MYVHLSWYFSYCRSEVGGIEWYACTINCIYVCMYVCVYLFQNNSSKGNPLYGHFSVMFSYCWVHFIFAVLPFRNSCFCCRYCCCCRCCCHTLLLEQILKFPKLPQTEGTRRAHVHVQANLCGVSLRNVAEGGWRTHRRNVKTYIPHRKVRK